MGGGLRKYIFLPRAVAAQEKRQAGDIIKQRGYYAHTAH